jgi:carbonic anhydrase/acetyltransferase-like protein (isoleucine patch superfamily)
VPIYALGYAAPSIDPQAYVHPDAVVIGSVELAAGASVWPGTVLRGDHGLIRVGERTSVQDGAGAEPARVCGGAVVAAAALVREDMTVPAGALAVGVPAAIRTEAGLRQQDWIKDAVQTYLGLAERHRTGLRRID